MLYQWGCWQMKLRAKLLIATGGAVLLSSCATSNNNLDTASRAPIAGSSGVTDDVVKLGDPYKVAGTTYTPVDVVDYDDVGYASWYGEEMAGRPTANGEIFNPNDSSAAHKTLPLPSYVEVTRLDTGHTILVRVNDRGPFANDRLVDLSYGAAQQLGIDQQGVSAVRVRRVNPPAQVRAQLRSGQPATPRNETSESLLTILRDKVAKLPQPAVPSRQIATTPVPVTSATVVPSSDSDRFIVEGEVAASSATPRVSQPAAAAASNSIASSQYYVQVAAFGSRQRAETLATKIDAKVMQSASGSIFRVRYGPYNSNESAEQGLQTARQRGYSSAKIFRGN